MMRIVQLANANARRLAVVREPKLILLSGHTTLYDLAQMAVHDQATLHSLIERHTTSDELGYDEVYDGRSEWRLLSPIDHPQEPARCLVSGTGLTHLGSAEDRHAMHEAGKTQQTDSMKMFRWGIERGRPADGEIGVAPEWFYKGPGTVLRAHDEPLVVPSYADDGGEEGEIAAVYLVGPDGTPYRLGLCNGNEFADHVFEKRNYLNLAGSKLRTCSLGPELVLDPPFESVPGTVALFRDAKPLWSKDVCTGEKEMCHSLANIEHHHFKFDAHRRPGDVHVHYLGACSLSFGAGLKLADGDIMQIGFEGFGRPLRNPLRVHRTPPTQVTAKPL